MGLNFMGLLTSGFFSLNRGFRLHKPWLVESADAELQIGKANCKVISELLTLQRFAPQSLCCSGDSCILFYIKFYLIKQMTNWFLF